MTAAQNNLCMPSFVKILQTFRSKLDENAEKHLKLAKKNQFFDHFDQKMRSSIFRLN